MNRFTASNGAVNRFLFDSIYQSGDSEPKFSDLVPFINSFLNGRNVCVFTHGVTGMSFNFSRRINFSTYEPIDSI